MTTLTASVSVLLVVAVVVATWLGRERAAALRMQHLAEAAERERTEQLLQSLLHRARAVRWSRRVGQRFASLKAIQEAAALARELGKPPAVFDEMRNEAIASLAIVDLRPLESWTFRPAGEKAVFDSALATCASYVGDRGTIVVQRTGDGNEVHRLEGFPQHFANLRLSPDGRFLATWNNHRLKAWRLSPGPPRLFYDDAAEVAFDDIEPWIVALFSPDSRRMILTRAVDRTLRVYDLESGRLARSIPLGEFTQYGVFHPGSRLLAVGLGETIQVWDIESGRPVGRAFPHRGGRRPQAWSPDGSMLVTCPYSEDVMVWSMPDGALLHHLVHRGGGTLVAFDPSGEILHTGSSWVPSLRLWHARTGRLLLSDDRCLDPDVFAATARLGDGRHRELVEVATAREYRAFTNVPRTEGGYCEPSIDPSGRLLVVPDAGGLGFWEAMAGAKLGVLPLVDGRHSFFDGSGDLWTNSDGGLLHWPVRWGSDGAVRIGPPDLLTTATTNRSFRGQGISASRDGRVAAVAILEGAVVLDRDRPGRGIWLGPQSDCRNVAVSPDGRYVLTTTHSFRPEDHDTPPASVWDAHSGRRLKAFDRASQARFTGDGRSLLAGGRFWRLGSWEPGPTVDVVGGDFAEGAGLLATGNGHVISLVSVATGHEVARLEDPNQEVGTLRSFTPDGTRLFTTGRQSESIHAWDLRLIRRRLDELGLDWEAPPFPPEAPRPDPPRRLVFDFGSMEPLLDDPRRLLTRYGVALAFRPLDAEVLLRRAIVRIRLKRWDEALADAQAAAEIASRDRRAWFLVGWIQLTFGPLDEAVAVLRRAIDCPAGPGDHPFELDESWLLAQAARRCVIDPAQVREPGRVLPLISAAVEILPLPSYRSTLGVVYYRLERYRDAIDCFERSLDQQIRGERAVVLYFLAMSYHRAGDAAKARSALDRAVDLQARIEFEPPDLAKINAYRAEAERTLADSIRPRSGP